MDYHGGREGRETPQQKTNKGQEGLTTDHTNHTEEGGTGDLKFHNLRFEIGPVARGERILLGQWNHDQNILQKQTKAAKAE